MIRLVFYYLFGILFLIPIRAICLVITSMLNAFYYPLWRRQVKPHCSLFTVRPCVTIQLTCCYVTRYSELVKLRLLPLRVSDRVLIVLGWILALNVNFIELWFNSVIS